jgi:hypothetical protein
MSEKNVMTPIAMQAPSDATRQVTDICRHVDALVTAGDSATLSKLLARLTLVEDELRALLMLTSSLLAAIQVKRA